MNEFGGGPDIRITHNGPYRVRGDIALEGAEFGEGASREHYTLCRCGHSRNKPFCDGSHWYAGFKDEEAITIAKANRARGEAAQQWVRVGSPGDFEPGRVHAVAVGERTVAVVRTGDGLYALEGRCPHQGAACRRHAVRRRPALPLARLRLRAGDRARRRQRPCGRGAQDPGAGRSRSWPPSRAVRRGR